MNKQEYQQKLKNMKPPKFFYANTLDEAYEAGFEEAKNNALFEFCFLDEPEKPVVPRFVADWYEENKDNFENNLAYLINDYLNLDFAFIEDSNLKDWLDKDFNLNKPIETLMKMKFFGYEVEKEKLYVVAIPDAERNRFVQLWKNKDGKLFFNFVDKIEYGKIHLLTKEEIKQKDERLLQFAEEVAKVPDSDSAVLKRMKELMHGKD